MYFLCFQAEDGIRDLTVTGVQTCALPISRPSAPVAPRRARRRPAPVRSNAGALAAEQPELAGRDHDHHERPARSEEHTSELQSQSNLVCRLLLEKKKKHPRSCLGLRHRPP